jgi:hypothetical protein
VREAIRLDRRRRSPLARFFGGPREIPVSVVDTRAALIPERADLRVAYEALPAEQRAAIATSTPVTPSEPAAPAPTALPRVAGPGPVMTWSPVTLDDALLEAFVPPRHLRSRARVAWLGDRFVLASEAAGAVATSVDGQSWTLLDATDPQRAFTGVCWPAIRGSCHGTAPSRRRRWPPRSLHRRPAEH